jgi:hypothetical protein
MTTFWWHERDGADDAGPFTEQQIRQMLAEGSLSPQAGIRSSRHEPWPPGASGGRAGARTTPRLPRPFAGWFTLVVFSLLGWALFSVVVASLTLRHAGPVDARLHPWAWFGLGVALLLAVVVLGTAWWLLPRRLGAGAELVAMLRIAAAIVAVAWLIQVGIVLRDTPMAIRQAAVLHDQAYLISAGPDDHTLFVQGDVGVGFGQKLAGRLAALPDPARIVIESPGGLVDEALVAAEAIERRRATVVVSGLCASACIIVLMAGEKRLAPTGGSILFHATAPVVVTANAMANWLAGQEGDRSRAYLLKRGVPAADIDEARRRGAKHVFAVPNAIALRQGVLTDLYVANDTTGPD